MLGALRYIVGGVAYTLVKNVTGTVGKAYALGRGACVLVVLTALEVREQRKVKNQMKR